MTPALALALLLGFSPPAHVVVPDAEGPLTLDRAVAIALVYQPQLASARAQTRAAQGRATQGNAALLPQASAYADVTRAHAPGLVAGTSGTTGDAWSLGLSASQTLFDASAWYAASAGRSAAAAQADSERANLLSVVLTVRTSWFQAAAARDLVVVARETLANREAHLAQIKGFVEVGTRPEIDLAQARADRSGALVLLIAAENDLATAHALLNQAMGVAASTEYALGSAELAPLPGEDEGIEALMAEALAARPDVAARDRQREAQVATLRAAKGTYLPTLDASGRMAETGPAVDETKGSWSVSLTLNWAFLQGGRTMGRITEQQANLDALDADDEAYRQQIRLELEQARLSVRSARASVEASAEALLNARERLRLAEARYQAGLGSGIELSDAQVSVTTAAAAEVKSRFNLSSARAQLAAALGRS